MSGRPAIVFDLDGTLIDTSGDIVDAANHVRRRWSLPELEPARVLALVGHGAGQLVRGLLEVPALDDPRVERALERFRAHYRRHQGDRSRPYAGIEEALDELATVGELFVLSNKPHDAAVRELEIKGLAGRFRRIWGAGALAEKKPDPLGLTIAADLCGVTPDRVVMIGDMEVDVETGRRAGARTVLVGWGFAAPEAIRAAPDRRVERVAQLADAVRGLIGPS